MGIPKYGFIVAYMTNGCNSFCFAIKTCMLQFAEKELLESYKLALDCLYEKIKDDPLEGMMRFSIWYELILRKKHLSFVPC